MRRRDENRQDLEQTQPFDPLWETEYSDLAAYQQDLDDEFWEEDYIPPRQKRTRRGETENLSMAARASGNANPEIYGRPRVMALTQQEETRQQMLRARQAQASSGYDEAPRPVSRRKKRHPFRRFVGFLLVIALLAAGAYLLFTPPEQVSDGIRTRKAGVYNILLAATDYDGGRADTIMMATIDAKSSKVSLTSIPRDTIVEGGEKINSIFAYAGGGEAGAQALMDQAETLLGFRADGYVLVDYEVFRAMVDAMGGVRFDVPMEMTVDDPDDPMNVPPLTIPAGEQLLDGDHALAVCRYRYGYLMADIQRQYVQQSFLKAMLRQCVAPENWLQLPGVYSAVMENITTDLSGGNLRYLALKAVGGISDMSQNTLPGEPVDYYGASCFGLYGGSVVEMVNNTMNPYEEPVTLEDVYILSVAGGELVESDWYGVPFDASTYEYE